MEAGDTGSDLLDLILAEDGWGSVQELALPLGDLVGMNVEALGDHDDGLLAIDGFQSHLGLEGRRMVAPWSSGHL